MGQKLHPLGLRLGITQTHRATWFAEQDKYPRWILEDQLIRNYLLKTYPEARIVDIKIVRPPRQEPLLLRMRNLHWDEKKVKASLLEKIRVYIYTPYISNIVGTLEPKQKVLNLRYALSELCINYRLKLRQQSDDVPSFRLHVFIEPIENPFCEASMIADELITHLEDRKPFRVALKKTLKKIKDEAQRRKWENKNQHGLKGLRIQISGRLNGAEIARIEWTRKGRVPLHTLRADVGYVSKTAKTIHGILGIKVWTFTKENF